MKTAWVGLSVVLAASFAWGACGGGSPASACQHACDCDKNCSPKDEANCEADLSSQQTIADKAGCDGKFSDFASCMSGATCRAGELRVDDCAAEQDALAKCLDDAGFGGGHEVGGSSSGGVSQNSCDAAAAHVEQCTGQTATVGDCTPMVACESACIADASCGALTGQDPKGAQSLSNCIGACAN
ncbi:MAG TPA: hypothetical protein VHB21_26095 [Minicystis sp.]|nr:hypothetical protein [Minicystis sp.]